MKLPKLQKRTMPGVGIEPHLHMSNSHLKFAFDLKNTTFHFFQRSYLGTRLTNLTKIRHVLVSTQFLQTCTISKESERVSGNDLLI